MPKIPVEYLDEKPQLHIAEGKLSDLEEDMKDAILSEIERKKRLHDLSMYFITMGLIGGFIGWTTLIILTIQRLMQ